MDLYRISGHKHLHSLDIEKALKYGIIFSSTFSLLQVDFDCLLLLRSLLDWVATISGILQTRRIPWYWFQRWVERWVTQKRRFGEARRDPNHYFASNRFALDSTAQKRSILLGNFLPFDSTLIFWFLSINASCDCWLQEQNMPEFPSQNDYLNGQNKFD